MLCSMGPHHEHLPEARHRSVRKASDLDTVTHFVNPTKLVRVDPRDLFDPVAAFTI